MVMNRCRIQLGDRLNKCTEHSFLIHLRNIPPGAIGCVVISNSRAELEMTVIRNERILGMPMGMPMHMPMGIPMGMPS